MSAPAFTATLEHLGARLVDQRVALAATWLEQLERMLPLDARDVFPTPTLLDHIPELIAHIALRLHGGESDDAEADSRLMDKAEQLGVLRFDQQASVSQLLREYEVFCEILDAFVLREVAALGDRGDSTAAVLATSRVQQSVRALQQRTVDVMVASYARRIDRKTTQLRTFGQLVSHEIRQPLGVLQVVSRMLRRAAGGADDPAQMTQTLERNVVRLGEVADQLERLALLTQPRTPGLQTSPVDLSDVVGMVVEQLREVADGKGVHFEIASPLPVLAGGVDGGHVELALSNLMRNAVKYSDPGKTHRFVRVRGDAAEVADGGCPRLHIEDNGIGIPRAKLDLIFEHFVRAHADRDGELGVRGMGLGLAIVRDCLDTMGGNVAVQSVEGEGTSFTLEWPVSRPIDSGA